MIYILARVHHLIVRNLWYQLTLVNEIVGLIMGGQTTRYNVSQALQHSLQDRGFTKHEKMKKKFVSECEHTVSNLSQSVLMCECSRSCC